MRYSIGYRSQDSRTFSTKGGTCVDQLVSVSVYQLIVDLGVDLGYGLLV